jgi:hypothetical protein
MPARYEVDGRTLYGKGASMSVMIFAFVAGVLIGLIFNFYAVLPASILAALATVLTSSGSLLAIFLAATAVIAILQIGYLVGGILTYVPFLRHRRTSRSQEWAARHQ